MFPPNTWCLDVEIANAIPDYKRPGFYFRPDIYYCKDWGDHAGMGIAVIVVARPDDSDVRVFTGERGLRVPEKGYYDLLDFSRFLAEEARLLITYNGRMFDGKVLASKGFHIPPTRHLDFLFEIKQAIKQVAPKGYKLEDVSLRCGGPKKTGQGAEAPILWQRGQKDTVIEYCKNDIKMTCALARWYADNFARLPSPDPLLHVQLRYPQEVMING